MSKTAKNLIIIFVFIFMIPVLNIGYFFQYTRNVESDIEDLEIERSNNEKILAALENNYEVLMSTELPDVIKLQKVIPINHHLENAVLEDINPIIEKNEGVFQSFEYFLDENQLDENSSNELNILYTSYTIQFKEYSNILKMVDNLYELDRIYNITDFAITPIRNTEIGETEYTVVFQLSSFYFLDFHDFVDNIQYPVIPEPTEVDNPFMADLVEEISGD